MAYNLKMNNMSTFETNEGMRRKGSESREASFESKESKEEQEDKEMGAKERMEVTAGEVKTTKNRMKNIAINMQQVLLAVRQIRQQLGLDETNDDIPAVKRDEQTLAELKEKLVGLEAQMEDLKLALRAEEISRLQQMDQNLSNEELKKRAEGAVDNMLAELGYEQS